MALKGAKQLPARQRPLTNRLVIRAYKYPPTIPAFPQIFRLQKEATQTFLGCLGVTGSNVWELAA